MSATGIEAQVCADIERRQKMGLAKYGKTVADNPLPLVAWLKHAYEECLDQAIYLKRAMHSLGGGDWGESAVDQPGRKAEQARLNERARAAVGAAGQSPTVQWPRATHFDPLAQRGWYWIEPHSEIPCGVPIEVCYDYFGKTIRRFNGELSPILDGARYWRFAK